MSRNSLEMRLALREMRCNTLVSAEEWKELLEAGGFFVSIMRQGRSFILYYWY